MTITITRTTGKSDLQNELEKLKMSMTELTAMIRENILTS